ncbi:MAG: UDP-N-acetylglucosamine 2-epimerase (non-hydrolyzing) [Myxococcales bacterium]|nr:MAG: UDP-N-acetylglucosamine 2-epimerase (non-hydrolyzing) [Myxococcales bacterium]
MKPLKVLTVLGTRPEIIRLSLIIAKLDRYATQIVVHTGQNFEANLDAIFFDQLGVRKPDYHLGARGLFGEQMGTILSGCEKIMREEKPDKFLVLGDTNSALAAIVAKRLGIPVYHMEAGNRCHDDRVPEEVNRRIIDHSSDVLLPYTANSKANLVAEGIPPYRIYVTGNPINEVLRHFTPQIEASAILTQLGLAKGRYFLVTMHRAENVDIPERLDAFLDAFDRLSREHRLPVVVSTHPRTRARLAARGGAAVKSDLRFLDPFGFFDFVNLEQNAFCVLSDSGTVQEECAIFNVPSVTIRDVTERPETLEAGSNTLSGAEPERIVDLVRMVLAEGNEWRAPAEYLDAQVSKKVVKIVLGHHLDFKPRHPLS